MDYSYKRTSKTAYVPTLRRINKVRERTHPPQKPLLDEEFDEVLREVEALEWELKKAFGSDYRLIVMGNGVKIY